MAFPNMYIIRRITLFGRSQIHSLSNSEISSYQASYLTLITKRYKQSKTEFPKEDGPARIMKIHEKLNKPDPRTMKNKSLPNDYGSRIDSPNLILQTYIPPEKGQKVGFKGRLQSIKMKLITLVVILRLRSSLKEFRPKKVSKLAQQKYIDVNMMLQQENLKTATLEILLRENAIESLASELKESFDDPARKIYWRFIKEVEQPKIVNGLIADISEERFVQLTIRLHTEQILAIRDRHNRLISGDRKKPRQIVEYIILERNLMDMYGRWRIAAKFNSPQLGQMIQQQQQLLDEKQRQKEEKQQLQQQQETPQIQSSV